MAGFTGIHSVNAMGFSAELRLRDSFGDEWVVVHFFHADRFAEETGLTPLDSASARSKVAWWVRGRGPIADALIQRILKPSPHGVFLPNAAEQAVEDAFYSGWKLFKLPRPERKPVKLAEDVAGATEKYVPPPPPPATTEEKIKTWFEVKVVDEFGKAIDGLEVVFSQGPRQETLETNGAGVVRWKDVEGPSFASVKVANLATLRDLLKPRYAKGGERKTPDGADVTKVMLGLEDPGKALSAETPGILVIAKPLTRVRLIGMHFDTNKCFLRDHRWNGRDLAGPHNDRRRQRRCCRPDGFSHRELARGRSPKARRHSRLHQSGGSLLLGAL